jgi:hypothetical protein
MCWEEQLCVSGEFATINSRCTDFLRSTMGVSDIPVATEEELLTNPVHTFPTLARTQDQTCTAPRTGPNNTTEVPINAWTALSEIKYRSFRETTSIRDCNRRGPLLPPENTNPDEKLRHGCRCHGCIWPDASV